MVGVRGGSSAWGGAAPVTANHVLVCFCWREWVNLQLRSEIIDLKEYEEVFEFLDGGGDGCGGVWK